MKNLLNYGQKSGSGIYQIFNTKTGTFYIGSAYNLSKRYSSHKYLLLNNKHWNKKLQASYNKHGANSFEFRLLEYCDKQCVIEREQFYFDTLKPYYNYNPTAGNCAGRKLSPEHIEAIKRANIGVKRTDQQKKAVGDKNRGRRVSEVIKKQISEKLKGRSLSDNVKQKIRNTLKGKEKPETFIPHTTKLTPDIVLQIRCRGVDLSINDVYKEFIDIASYQQVYDIIKGKTWKKIKGPCGHFH